jgi:hypothetical protein
MPMRRSNVNPNRFPPDKNGNYSPSTNYNWNPGATGGNHQGQFQQQNQHPRRRVDRYRRETYDHSERLVKQNDTIIRLLKEIRDRLPPPPGGVTPEPSELQENQTMVSPQSDMDEDDGGGNVAGDEQPR